MPQDRRRDWAFKFNVATVFPLIDCEAVSEDLIKQCDARSASFDDVFTAVRPGFYDVLPSGVLVDYCVEGGRFSEIPAAVWAPNRWFCAAYDPGGLHPVKARV